MGCGRGKTKGVRSEKEGGEDESLPVRDERRRRKEGRPTVLRWVGCEKI